MTSSEFDEKAKSWDSDPVKVERARVIAEAIRKRVPLHPQVSALEYGCGTGLLSFALQPYLGEITLADSSQGMLAVLEEKIASGGIRNMTPRSLDLAVDPLPEDRYTLIYTMMTLHHIPETERILRCFHSVLENGGYLCIADLEKEDGSFHGADFSGHPGFDRRELAEKTEKAGFRNIGFATVFKMTKETDHGRKSFPVFLMVAEKAS